MNIWQLNRMQREANFTAGGDAAVQEESERHGLIEVAVPNGRNVAFVGNRVALAAATSRVKGCGLNPQYFATRVAQRERS